MVRPLLISAVASLLCVSAASAGDLDRSQDIHGGRVRVQMQDLPVDAPATGPRVNPRVGVSSSLVVADGVAHALDDGGKVRVVSPSRFTAAGSFDTLTRSEFADDLSAACSTAKVNYALYASTAQIGSGMSPTALILGFGRTKYTQSFELRLYDCGSKKAVWKQRVVVENSQGIWTNGFTGNGTIGGGESEAAGAKLISDKLVMDMGW